MPKLRIMSRRSTRLIEITSPAVPRIGEYVEWTKVEKVGLPATTRRVGKVDKVTYILYENPEDSYVLISVINVERA